MATEEYDVETDPYFAEFEKVEELRRNNKRGTPGYKSIFAPARKAFGGTKLFGEYAVAYDKSVRKGRTVRIGGPAVAPRTPVTRTRTKPAPTTVPIAPPKVLVPDEKEEEEEFHDPVVIDPHVEKLAKDVDAIRKGLADDRIQRDLARKAATMVKPKELGPSYRVLRNVLRGEAPKHKLWRGLNKSYDYSKRQPIIAMRKAAMIEQMTNFRRMLGWTQRSAERGLLLR